MSDSFRFRRELLHLPSLRACSQWNSPLHLPHHQNSQLEMYQCNNVNLKCINITIENVDNVTIENGICDMGGIISGKVAAVEPEGELSGNTLRVTLTQTLLYSN